MRQADKPPARRPRGEREETRREILRAAMDVFGANGFQKASLQEIGDRVGMTHSGVLHHFGSKTQLLKEVVEFRDKSDLEDIEGQQIPGGEDLFRHLLRTARMNAERPGVVQTYAVLSADSVTEGHPTKEYFRARFETLRQALRDAFRHSAPDIDFTDKELDDAATAILGAMDGIQVQWLLDPEAVDLVGATRAAINAIFTSTSERRATRFE